jgi:NADH dehydrogenase FAD-containing subunit
VGLRRAKYLKVLSKGSLDITLIDPSQESVSCPMSNLILSEKIKLSDITKSRTHLTKDLGVHFVQDSVTSITPQKRLLN